MNSYPTAQLWLFAYTGITGGTHLCALRDALRWPNLTHSVMNDDALISRSRSRAASRFLQAPRSELGDVLLMVDHDITWQEGDLAYIACRALEKTAIVGGIYPKRVFGQASASRFQDEGSWQIGSDDLIKSKYVGAGFVAIPRAILEALALTLPLIEFPQDKDFWPFFLPMLAENPDGTHEMLSEDWACCRRAKEAGFEVYSACKPKLCHEGTYTYRLVDAQARPPANREVTIRLNPTSSVASATGG